MDFSIEESVPFSTFRPSTYRNATAIIAAASHMRIQFAEYRDKLFFVPENGIARSECAADCRSPEAGAKLELISLAAWFRARLATSLCAPPLRFCEALAQFTIIGDGPERQRLEEFADRVG